MQTDCEMRTSHTNHIVHQTHTQNVYTFLDMRWHDNCVLHQEAAAEKSSFKKTHFPKRKDVQNVCTFDGSLIGWLVDCLVWWPLIFMRFQYCTLSNQLNRMRRNVYYWHICRVVWNSLLLFLPFLDRSFHFSSTTTKTTLSFLPNPRPLQLSLYTAQYCNRCACESIFVT